jgi:RNA polymerase sigma-70 factor, ECF subfamily
MQADDARSPAGDPPDDALIAAAARGDRTAFDVLVQRHMARAWRIALRVTGNHADAEDAVQDAFVSALRALNGFESGRPFAPWLARIVLNRALNLRRSETLRACEALPHGLVAPGVSPLEAAERAELRAELRRAIAALPEPRRRIVELFELDRFTSREIGDIVGLAEGTVRWHVHEARAALRDALAPFRRTTA